MKTTTVLVLIAVIYLGVDNVVKTAKRGINRIRNHGKETCNG